MHRIPAFLQALVLGASFVAAAPALAETVKGSGVMKTEARSATGFKAIELGIPARVEVKLGATESVTVEADENLLPLIETSVKRGALEIKPVRRNLNLQSKGIRIVVQAKQVEQLELSGVGTIVADALKGRKVKVAIAGAGEIEVARIEADEVEAKIAGSGELKLAGFARKLDASIGGSGDVDAPGLVVDEADIDIAGSGAAQLGVRKLLDVTVAGSGAVRYFGDPVVKRTIIGAGGVKRAGPLPQ